MERSFGTRFEHCPSTPTTMFAQCETDYKREMARFKWIVRNISFSDRTENIVSSEFASLDREDIVWQFFFDEGDARSLFVRLVSLPGTKVCAQVRCQLRTDRVPKWQVNLERAHGFTAEQNTIGWRHVINQNELASDETLYVYCIVEFNCSSTNRSMNRWATKEFGEQADQWLGESLFQSRLLGDFTFVVDGVEIVAHKAVLAARSPVFAAMFRNEMREKVSNRADIVDVDADTFQELLRFIYTGTVEKLSELVREILAASIKCDLKDLQHLCELEMCRQMPVDNVVEFLVLDDFFRLLCSNVVLLVHCNGGALFETDQWKNLEKSHPHLFQLQFFAESLSLL